MGKKSSNQTTATSNTVSAPWKASKPLLKDLLAATSGAFGAGEFDIAPYQDPRIADQSGMTQQSLGMVSDIATAGNPFMGQAAEGYESFMNADPYRDLDMLKSNALGDIMPAAMRPFSGSGMLDSTLAADAAGRAATEAIAPYDYGAWNQMQGRKLSALGMAPGLAASSYLDPTMLGQAGQQQDAFNQSQIDAEMAKYYEGANQSYDELQRAASLALGFGGMGGSTSGTSTQQQPGGGLLGTAGGVIQTLAPLIMMGMAGSDRRLKTDIKRIGETGEGYPKYEFRYLWDAPDMVRIGVMADEVPPEITFDIGPFKGVDYMKVTL